MKKSYLYVIIAVFCWSTAATVCKLLLNDINSMQLLWINSFIAGVSLLVAAIFGGNFKKHKDYTVKDYLVMTAVGLPGTLLYYLLYYTGTALMPASQAFVINYLWPIMSVVFACIVLKESITARKVIAIFISFFGVVVVIGAGAGQFDNKTLMGAVCCILGAVSYGVFSAFSQKKCYDKTILLAASYLVTFVVTTIINAFEGTLFLPQISQLPGFLWNGIFAIAVANTLWVVALEKGDTAKLSNFTYITPLLSSMWTCIFLKEKITLNLVIGLLIIMLGIFIQMNEKKQKN